MKRMVSLLLTLVLALLLAAAAVMPLQPLTALRHPATTEAATGTPPPTRTASARIRTWPMKPRSRALRRTTTAKRSPTGPPKRSTPATWRCRQLDFDKASRRPPDALVKELGGYFQQSSVSNRGNSGYRYGSYTIRIPSAQFDTFLQKAGTLCHLVYSSTGTDDVSETYYDTEARLETARIKLERLQALLAKATSMDDIITIESAISETEWDIENLSGTLRRYDALVDYATIDVELSEVYKLSGQDEAVTTFGGRLGQSFVNGLRAVGSALEDFAVWLAYSWVWLLVIAAVIVVVVRVVRRKSGGKKFSLKRKGKDADAETKE